jgi:hypothetical protein
LVTAGSRPAVVGRAAAFAAALPKPAGGRRCRRWPGFCSLQLTDLRELTLGRHYPASALAAFDFDGQRYCRFVPTMERRL